MIYGAKRRWSAQQFRATLEAYFLAASLVGMIGYAASGLATRQMLGSAEDFIAKAATRSSLTGEAYAIRCPQRPVQPSAVWLESELQALRSRQTRGGAPVK